MSDVNPHWHIVLHRDAEKILQKLPKNLLDRIRAKIYELRDNPRPKGCKKLAGHNNLFRIRMGEWRITYAIVDDELVILILEISTRGSAYRNF